MKLLNIIFESVVDMYEVAAIGKDEFIRRSRKVHGNRYGYDNVDYVNTTTKVMITCPIHGDVPQIPRDHMNGNGCRYCHNEFRVSTRKTTSEEFFKRLYDKFKNDKITLPDGSVVPRYDFSKSVFNGSRKPITFYCNKIGKDGKPHGPQTIIRAANIINRGFGCKECSNEKTSDRFSSSQDLYIKKAEELWGKGRWDYSNLNYKGSEEPVDIICHRKDENGVEHGPFRIERAQWFISKKNRMYCKQCTAINRKEVGAKQRLSQDDYLDKVRKIHINVNGSPKYTYEKVEDGTTPYLGGVEKILVTCPKHGTFPVRAQNHKDSKSGCPKCFSSLGESEMRRYLYTLGYDTNPDHKFDDCTNTWKGKRCFKYKFDAYVEELNTVFEFDGQQHFDNSFNETKERFMEKVLDDKFKNDYCLKNKIKLVRISYLDIKDIKNQIDKSLENNDMLWLSDKYPKNKGWRMLK